MHTHIIIIDTLTGRVHSNYLYITDKNLPRTLLGKAQDILVEQYNHTTPVLASWTVHHWLLCSNMTNPLMEDDLNIARQDNIMH